MKMDSKPAAPNNGDTLPETHEKNAALEPDKIEYINQRLGVYAELTDALRKVERKGRFTSWIYPPLTSDAHHSASLAWVYTGVKPAMLLKHPSKRAQKALENAGLSVAGQYIYDPKHVQHIIEQNPDIGWGSNDPHEVMQTLERERLTNASTRRGLLLGYPRQAVESYNKHEALLEKHKYMDRLAHRSTNTEEEKEVLDVLLGVTPRHNVDIDMLAGRLARMLEQYENASPEVAHVLANDFAYAKEMGAHGFKWISYGNHGTSQGKTEFLHSIEEQTEWRTVVPGAD